MAGYQKGNCGAFNTGQTDINGIYVDGISITQGSPLQHVWTYAVGQVETYYSTCSYVNGIIIACPCSPYSTQQAPAPSFVGNDYYCESGNPIPSGNLATIYSDDILWDGNQCRTLEAQCCTSSLQPWFRKVLDI